MSQNPYNPGALEGGAPPPYYVSGPPPAYSQYAPTYSYPSGGPPQPLNPSAPPQSGFQPSGGPPYQPGGPPYQSSGPPYQPGGPPYQSGGPQVGFQPSYAQPPTGRGAVIRNVNSGLVVDGSEYDVRLQQYSGSPFQVWILEPVNGGGRFIVKNKGNGAVLDIEGGPDCGACLITYENHGGDNQQWYINNPDHTITSAAADLAVDVREGNCVPGNNLIAYDRHGGPNQQFRIEYQ